MYSRTYSLSFAGFSVWVDFKEDRTKSSWRSDGSSVWCKTLTRTCYHGSCQKHTHTHQHTHTNANTCAACTNTNKENGFPKPNKLAIPDVDMSQRVRTDVHSLLEFKGSLSFPCKRQLKLTDISELARNGHDHVPSQKRTSRHGVLVIWVRLLVHGTLSRSV